MNAYERLYQWEAGAGAGKDAAGRTVYTGPNMLYMGNREYAATKAEHRKMEIAAAKADPQGMMIRELLERVKHPNPALAQVSAYGGVAMRGNQRRRPPDPPEPEEEQVM